MSEKKKPKKRRIKGEGSIYPYRDGWAGSVELPPDPFTGKRRRKAVYGKTRKEVADKIRAAREEPQSISVTPNPESEEIMIKDYLGQWLDTVRDSLSESTQLDYEKRLQRLVYPYLPMINLGDFRPSHVLEMIDRQRKDGLSTDQRRRALVRLRQALKHAVRLQYIPSNPAEMIPLPRRGETSWYILDQNEVEKLLRACSGRWEAFFSLAIDSGARINELLALQWGDLDLSKRELKIQRAWSKSKKGKIIKSPKTRAGNRTIILTKNTVSLLKPLTGEKGGWMWVSKLNIPYKNETFHHRVWKPTLKRAGLPKEIRFHDLRHTCASLLLGAGDSVVSVAARLGHASPDITLKVYSHFIPQTGVRSADLLEKIIGRT